MQTLFGKILRQRALAPQLPSAIVSPGCELTFTELHGRVERCAAWLVGEGCRPSELVGITIADELTHLVASLALLQLGLPQICLPTYDPVAMRSNLARRLSVARVVVADPQHVLPGHPASLLTPECLAPMANAAQCDAVDADPDAPAMYCTSSGTTGEAKIVALSQRAIAWRAERRGFMPGERMLMLTSVEDHPAKTARLYCVYLGLTSVLQAPAPASPLAAEELCARFGATRLDLSVLQASDLVPGGVGGGRIRIPAGVKVIASGSRVPAKLRRAFAIGGTPLFIDYGAREVASIAGTWMDGRDEGQETVGALHPWIELEIVDDADRVLPAGEPGAVRVRSGGMIAEYWQDPVATARHFRDGWFYPGDIGSLTADGLLCIHGRADDMMNLNGIKIFPAEIERVLEDHPAVRAAAAFAVRSPVHGDIPVAAVELHAAATVGADELIARARERLGVRAPRRIVVVEALPRNAAGKIVKRDLAGLVVPGR
jgi:long-chain acyl-CoA synthetase